MRRTRIALFVAAIGWAALAAIPAHAETLRAGTPAANNSTFLPLRIAIERGVFTKEGLDIEASDFEGGAKLQQAMVAGAMDLAVTAGTDFAFVAKGAPELGVAAMGNHPSLGVVVPYNSPAKTADDLKGKTIGVTTVGSLTEWLMRRLIQQRGWAPDSVRLVAVGSGIPNQVALMTAGQIDGVVAPAALGLQLEQQQRGRLLIPSFDIGSTFLAEAIFASNRLLHDNPDGVRRFLTGWFENINWMFANKHDAVELLRKHTGYSPEVESKEYDLVMPGFSTTGKFDPAAVKALEQSFVEMKLVDHPVDLSKFYTEAYLPAH